MAARNEKLGAAVPIRALFRQIQLSMKNAAALRDDQLRVPVYSQARFQRDLARIITSGQYSLGDGRRIELFPTAFAKEGIAVLVAEGMRYVGRFAISEPLR